MQLEECLIIAKSDLADIKRMLNLLLSRDNKSPLSDYVTEEAALEILGIKKSTLHSWKSKGRISFHKPDGNRKGLTYYKISDLLDFQRGTKHKSHKEIEAEANNYMINNFHKNKK